MYIWQHVYDLYSYENEHIWFTTVLKYVLPLFFFFILNFFFYQGFLSQTLTIHSAAGEGGEGRGGASLFLPTNSTRSRTFRHLFATLHVRWLLRIFNRIACNYQTNTQWDLPTILLNYHLIDWWWNLDILLFTWWFSLKFLLQQ